MRETIYYSDLTGKRIDDKDDICEATIHDVTDTLQLEHSTDHDIIEVSTNDFTNYLQTELDNTYCSHHNQIDILIDSDDIIGVVVNSNYYIGKDSLNSKDVKNLAEVIEKAKC